VEQLIRARRQAIVGVANQHEVDGIRWWPPSSRASEEPSWFDFLVEGAPGSLPAFQADLERALGRRVAIYLADLLTSDAWQRNAPLTVPV
jgi:hypothetical protein